MRLSRRNLILGGAATAGVGLLGGTSATASSVGAPRNLILVVAEGGWDTTYALDPKPGLTAIDAPAGDIQEFAGIPVFTDASRPAVTEFFEAYAGMTAVINGVQTQSIVHSDCAKRVLTGTASDANPDIGAITAFELGRDLPAPYLVLGRTSYTGPLASIAARAGTANQIGTLLRPETAFPVGDSLEPGFTPSSADEAAIRDYVLARADRLRARRGQIEGHNQARIDDFVASLERGDRLSNIGDFGDFDFTRDLSVQVGLGLRALEEELSWVVQLESGEWDTHNDNSIQQVQYESLFAGLKTLMDALTTLDGRAPGSKMIDETVVAVVSEMGRTPLLNEQGGKDHWPVTSALVLGAGVAGGSVFGGTTDRLDAMSVDMTTGETVGDGKQLQYGNLAAGLLQLVGVDPATYLAGSEPFHAICA